jgi:RNA polymerase sigma factor (sigma-70 family)
MREVRLDEPLVARLYERGHAHRWGVRLDRFSAALAASVSKAFPAGCPRADQLERYLMGLHLEDMALSCACADGHEGAWEHFIREYRPALYRAADAIDHTGRARELADGLYGELFGLTVRDGERQSLFRYFHGRSTLATWLRAVLAQRHVDRVRAVRKLHPLPPEDHATSSPAVRSDLEVDRTRFQAAMRAAIGAATQRLEPRDRLRLACYYAHGLTLAHIGRGLGEHEATVSRNLARTRRALRRDVERQLRHEHGMGDSAIEECFALVVDDAGHLDLAEVLSESSVRKNAVNDRST